MKILSIEEIPIKIGFTLKFKHNTQERDEIESFFVKITTHSGEFSFGEGCPRSYVTNESVESCKIFLDENRASIREISSFEELTLFVDKNEDSISLNPSAWCAIELSLLDLLAKERSESVEGLLGLKAPKINHHVTGVIGINNPFNFFKKLLKYRLYGLADFKIKLSGNLKQDKNNLSMFRYTGISSDHVRVDANNIWGNGLDCINYLNKLSNQLWSIEEPLLKGNVSEFVKIFEKTGKRIILDESFLKFSDFEEIKKYPEIFIVNLRISKMGGILRSLRIIKEFKKYNFNFILGTHVGETSLLGRAWLLIAENFNELIIAKEGAYSSHLLNNDPASPEIKFGIKGVVNIEDLQIEKTGWGIDFEE